MKKLYILIITFLITALSYGQATLPFYEGFDYVVPSVLQTQTGYTAVNTGDDLIISTGSLNYTGLQASTGNKLAFAGGGIDATKLIATQNSGTVYYSLLLKVNSMTGVTEPNGGYLIGFVESGTIFGGTLWTKRVDDSNFNFGIEVRTGTGTSTTWTSTSYSIGQIYYLVVSYTFGTAASDDVVKLWINPVPGQVEPSPNVTDSHTGGTDLASITRFLFRQDSTTETPDLEMDEVRIGTTWADVTPPGNTVAPPTLAIFNGPPNGWNGIMSPDDTDNANISFVTTNFTMSGDNGSGGSNGAGDGYIKWKLRNVTDAVDMSSGNVFTSNDNTKEFPLTGMVPGKKYTFTAELVDNAGNPLSTPVVYTITATFATFTNVANLGELRLSAVSPDIYYKVTGEVFNTYTRNFGKNQYFQDASGGILVYDNNNDENSTINVNDGVTDMRGHLELYNGTLELIPTSANWTVSSMGNTITPAVVTLDQINKNLETYESKLVKVETVTVSELSTGGNGNFQPDKSYIITDASGTGIFRTGFSEANYIGTLLPATPVSLICLVIDFNGTAQITALSSSGILGNKEEMIEGFAIYPNPVSNVLYIHTSANLTKNVQIYDVLGKQLVSKVVDGNSMEINLRSGFYVIKVEEDGKVATQKLMVK